MPNYGLGVYLKMLSEDSKKIARDIMRNAFATAAQNHKVKIKWVIYTSEAAQLDCIKNNP